MAYGRNNLALWISSTKKSNQIKRKEYDYQEQD